MLNVSRESAQRARQVLDQGEPELVPAVERGDVAVSTARLEAVDTSSQTDAVVNQ
jgi:hypothetical protein